MGVPVDGVGFADDAMARDPGPFLDMAPGWPWLLLAALVLIGLGWLIGRNASARPTDGADGIWTTIDKAASAALRADDADLPGRAEALRKVLDQKLGATARLTGGHSDLRAALDAALDGKAHTPHGHDSEHGSAHGHGDAGHADDHGGHAEPVATPSTQIIINTGGGHEAPPRQSHDHAPAYLSPKERNNALRLAVSDLSQHWRQEAARKAELRAAYRELSAS